MGRNGGFMEFKPARRVFAGRGRSMLTFGEWRLTLAGIAFGGLIGAGWFFNQAAFDGLPAPLAALDQPPAETSKTALAVAAPAAPPIEAAMKVAASRKAETTDPSTPSSDAPPRRKAILAFDYSGKIARVVDGDTFYLEGLPTRIRLWGVDAPERDEEGFDEATAMLATLVYGKTLSCEHVDIDPYRRIVARCYFDDGSDLSESMIDSGAAEEFLRFTRGYYTGG